MRSPPAGRPSKLSYRTTLRLYVNTNAKLNSSNAIQPPSSIHVFASNPCALPDEPLLVPGARPDGNAGGFGSAQGEPPGARMPVMVARVDADGVITLLSNAVYYIEEGGARETVAAALATGRTSGVLNEGDWRFMVSGDGGYVALADISMERELIKGLIINALLIGGAALAAFFAVGLVLSRWAVRPVERAWERQRQFIADASHELKTPLTVILSNADMLGAQAAQTDGKQARRVEHIRAESARMKRLVEDLLILARSDSAQHMSVLEDVDYSFIVTSAALAYEPVALDERKVFTHDVRDNLHVLGDGARLGQLTAILLDNAFKYCPAGGRVALTLAEGERRAALLTVTNDGEPIPQDELERIFRRFYRVDRARSAHGGFGLGLSIAEGIVNEHGGRIWAESRAGAGSIFHVSLPMMNVP